MKRDRIRYYYLVRLAVLLGGVFGAGCQGPAEKAGPAGPVFFPEPPDQPRLQFLTSLSGAGDLGAKGPGFLETFIVGQAQPKEALGKPYGVAIFEGKIYICDVAAKAVAVVDLNKRTLESFSQNRMLKNPVNIFIEKDGTKYISDSGAGVVFVFDRDDKLVTLLGQNMNLKPLDIVVRGDICYLSDLSQDQVVIMNKKTGKIMQQIGKQRKGTAAELGPGEFSSIGNLALDGEGNIYVTDVFAGKVVKFNGKGSLVRTFGRRGDRAGDLMRPKGVAVDKEGRIWVADAGPAEAVKIYDGQGQFLLFFGTAGNAPGKMNLPAKVVLDYDNIELFRKYAVPGAELECLVLVTNQFGPNKVSIYGFGRFPDALKLLGAEAAPATPAKPATPAIPAAPAAPATPAAPTAKPQ